MNHKRLEQSIIYSLNINLDMGWMKTPEEFRNWILTPHPEDDDDYNPYCDEVSNGLYTMEYLTEVVDNVIANYKRA